MIRVVGSWPIVFRMISAFAISLPELDLDASHRSVRGGCIHHPAKDFRGLTGFAPTVQIRNNGCVINEKRALCILFRRATSFSALSLGWFGPYQRRTAECSEELKKPTAPRMSFHG